MSSHWQTRFGTASVVGYVDGDENIRLSLLKHWLPINHPDLHELLEISFEAMLQGRNQDDRRIGPGIQKAFRYSNILGWNNDAEGYQQQASVNVSECSAETDLENDVSENLERANTWFSRVGVRLSTGKNLGDMLKGMLRHKATPGDVVARMLAGLQTAGTPGQV